MYDRAQRKLTKPLGSTAQHVGPGTYDDTVDCRRLKTDGYAPFLSMTTRDSFLNPTDTIIAAPGPGQYDSCIPYQSIPGGKTLANKSKRFADKLGENPGPGSYQISKKRDWIKEIGRTSNSAPTSLDGQENKTRPNVHLMSNRIKFHRKPEAPSIPTPGQAYGYEENEDGTLKKQDVPEKDKTIGPAFYNVEHEPYTAVTTKIYKGNHWGKYTSGRMEFGGKDGPGPGEYERSTTVDPNVENSNIKEERQQRFDAKIPRYHEMIEKIEEKKHVPGPGKYDVKGEFDLKDNKPKVNMEGIEIERPPFMSQAKRFGPDKNGNPAPGYYNDPRTALDGLKRISGLKRSPFGQTSVRFMGEHHIKKTPGPGSYNYPGIGSNSMRKAYLESTRRGAFGTTSVRIHPMVQKEEIEQPGPSHYNVKQKVQTTKYQQKSSVFSSLSTRLHEPHAIVRELPPPGSYNVDQSYKKTQEKVEPGPARTCKGKQRRGAFKSSASRFAPPRDTIIAETDPANPGPTSYDPKVRVQTEPGNPLITKDKRFKELSKLETPAPNAYEFPPLIQDTVLRGTFNATLGNPLTPKMDKRNKNNNQQFVLGV